MARLPRSGISFATLDEREVTLKDVISGLGFRPLPDKDERFVRSKMGFAIGQWWKTEGDYQAIGTKLDIEGIRRSLESLQDRLNEVHYALAAVEEGIHHVHDIEVVGNIVSALSKTSEIASVAKAQELLSDFRRRAETIAHGIHLALSQLSSLPKPRHGRVQLDWHDDFTRAVILVIE
jgi:hypothetical protein